MGVILQMTLGARKAHNICRRITRRVNLWYIGKHAALCSETVAEIQSHTSRTTRENEETKASTFNSKVVNRKIWAAVQGIRGQGQSGVFYPGNIDSKTG